MAIKVRGELEIEGAEPWIIDIMRGVDPAVARDLGEPVPEDTEISIPMAPTEEDTVDRLAALEEVSIKDAQNANARQKYLLQLVKEVGRTRRLEGFAVNHDVEPRNRDQVEAKGYSDMKKSQETLSRACGRCALAPTCPIRNDLSAWIATHPYANSDSKALYTWATQPQVRQAESRMNFVKRVSKDPLADCVPQSANSNAKAA